METKSFRQTLEELEKSDEVLDGLGIKKYTCKESQFAKTVETSDSIKQAIVNYEDIKGPISFQILQAFYEGYNRGTTAQKQKKLSIKNFFRTLLKI